MQEKSLGILGEQEICSFLQNKQFRIVQKNYRSRWGEIDIIAEHNEVLAFIEVKTRRTEYFPISMVVNKTKQQKIVKTAKHFLACHPISYKIIRFDVATVVFKQNTCTIEYIPNAFTAQYR